MLVLMLVFRPVVLPSRPASVLLVGLALTSLVSGCGGASPETRARQTWVALHGTRTPTPLQAARTAITQGTVTGIDQESVVMLTAEAMLRIRTSEERNMATHMAEMARD